MTSNSTLGYPAEYYYPELSDNRQPDDHRQSPRAYLPVTNGMDQNGGSSARMPQAFKHNIEGTDKSRRSTARKDGSTTVNPVIATNQGLPDVDITQAVQTDPKTSLLRDPVEKNIPRLIVDDSIIKQTVRTTKVPTISVTDSFGYGQISETTKPKVTRLSANSKSTMNGDLANGKTKAKPFDPKATAFKNQQQLQYIEEEEPPVDDFWKKEVHIDEEGAVSIAQLKYDKAKYEGPFGLTRQAATVFFIVMIVFTLLAAIFLIMTGVFYARSYPDATNNTAKLAGIGICGFAFYFGLQLILIALWHQKYRQENPKRIVSRASLENDSTTQLKNSMETNEQYDYPYGQPVDYPGYGAYPPAPYTSYVNDPTMYPQPVDMTTAVPYYDPTGWPTSTTQVDDGLDPRFFQSMEATYGTPTNAENPTISPYPTVPLTTVDTTTKPKKKGTATSDRSKTVEANPPKAKLEDLYPNSTVTDTTIPTLKKAPVTNDLMRSIAEKERTKSPLDLQGTSFATSSKGKKKNGSGSDVSSSNDQNGSHRRHRHRRRRHHHRHHHHRRSSYSSCSTCSDHSPDDYHSEVNINPNLLVQPENIKAKGPTRLRARTLSPSTSMMRMNYDGKLVKDSGVSVGLEDVPNVADDRLEQVPVVRRTIIVEPYPADPTSKIVVKPTGSTGKKGKKKKKAVTTDIRLEDVNDDDQKGYTTTTMKKTRIIGNGTTVTKQRGKNAFNN